MPSKFLSLVLNIRFGLYDSPLDFSWQKKWSLFFLDPPKNGQFYFARQVAEVEEVEVKDVSVLVIVFVHEVVVRVVIVTVLVVSVPVVDVDMDVVNSDRDFCG